jgi:hypothetical protein
MAGTFNRLDPLDFVISADSITSTLWSGNNPTLTTFFLDSSQTAGSSGDYYYNVFQSNPAISSGAEIQFAIAYGNEFGSGSVWYNSAVPGASPTRTTYGQYRTLVLGDEYSGFVFGNVSSSDFWALSIDRSRYKQSLFPGSLTLKLRGPNGDIISLTDNSQYVPSLVFNDAGRVFQLISGSSGTGYFGAGVNSNGFSPDSGSYGYLLPDIGTILLNPLALSQSINLEPNRTLNSDGGNYQILFNAINGTNAKFFRLNSEETISSDYIFIRARNAEFNYSENPSFISGSTGDVIYGNFINNPQTFPTTIGLYNDANELLAVAKLSRPLLKDFTKEALVRVKLDF